MFSEPIKQLMSNTGQDLSRGKKSGRRLDQDRNLFRKKIDWEDIDGIAEFRTIEIVSLHSHETERNRMKGNSGVATGGKPANLWPKRFWHHCTL